MQQFNLQLHMITCKHLSFVTLFYEFYNLSPSFKLYYYFCDYVVTIKLHILPSWLIFWIFHPWISSYVHLVPKLIAIWFLTMVCIYILCTLWFVYYIKNILYTFYSGGIKHLLSMFNILECILNYIPSILSIFYSWYVKIFSLYSKYIKHIFDHVIRILDWKYIIFFWYGSFKICHLY